MKKQKIFTLVCVVLILIASLPLFKINPVKATTPTTGRTNGLTLVLDSMGSRTVAQIVTFMNTYHYNAIKFYTGWANSYWGTTWSGDVDDPIPTSAKTKIKDMIGNASLYGWPIHCTISTQLYPATLNTTWRDNEIQCGYTGTINPTYNNYMDFAGTYSRRYQVGLVKAYTQMMEDKNVIPKIGFEEIQYVSDGGGYPAIYAKCMNDSYYASTGNRPPVITYSSSHTSWTSTQWTYINFVNATVQDFHNAMVAAAWSINSSTMFDEMIDDMTYYPDILTYTLPLNYFANTSVYNSIQAQTYTKCGAQNFAGITSWLATLQSWSPTVHAYWQYSYYQSESSADIRACIPYVVAAGYWGIWAYSLYSSGSAFYTSPLDVSDLIPNTVYDNEAANTTIAGTTCKFSLRANDSFGLNGYKFSYNGTGSWANDTYVSSSNATSAWLNTTKTLPSAGTVVGFQWFINSSTGAWTTTSLATITTTATAVDTELLGNPTDLSTVYTKAVTFYYTPTVFETIYGAAVWTNKSGTWQSVATNATKVVNETANSISYTFTESGTYVWNVKTSNVTGALIYAAANKTVTVVIEPYFGAISYNSTAPSSACLFSVTIYDGDTLAYAVLSTNNTGAMVNETRQALSGSSTTATWTKTLNSTYGHWILFRIYANDTDNNNVTSADYTFQLTMTIVNITVLNPVTGTYAVSTINVTISASCIGSTISSKVYNVLNGTSWVYPSNLTYTASTSMTGFITGTNYTFWTWVTAVDGTVQNASVFFQVSIPTSGHAGVRVISGSNIVVEGITFIDCAIGIYVDGSGDNYEFTNNNLTDCVYPFYWSGTVNAIVRDNPGYNPVGYISASVSVTGIYLVDHGSASIESGATYICTQSPKVVYVSGLVTAIYVGGMPVFSGEAIAVTIPLCVGDSFRVDFDILPDISVIVQ